MTDLTVSNRTKAVGPVTAIDNVTFKVADGEFVSLLGPSGCGKSTTLAAIAGLDVPTSGVIRAGNSIFYDGAGGRFFEPEARNFGLVFQSYYLLQHMPAGQHAALPLKLRHVQRRPRSSEGWG